MPETPTLRDALMVALQRETDRQFVAHWDYTDHGEQADAILADDDVRDALAERLFGFNGRIDEAGRWQSRHFADAILGREPKDAR